MKLTRIRQFASALGLVAAVLGAGALAQQQPTTEPRPAEANAFTRNLEAPAVEQETRPQEGQTRKVEKLEIRFAGPTESPGYWIGMQLDPASETLRSQLKIEGERGLVVTELFPDTPAVKSGFAKHDVVVKVDDQPVTDVESFNKIVQQTKGEKELTVVVYRGGEPHTIKVTPARRPGDQAFALLAPPADQEDVLMGWIPKGLDLEHPMRVEFYNPGLVVGRAREFKIGDLPKNVAISIAKSGEEPAKIHVSKDGKEWDVTEKELDKLPAEIREHVERMLRPGPLAARVHVRPHGELAPPRAVIAPHHPAPAVPPAVAPALPSLPADVDRRFDEVNKRLEELQKALDALVKQRAEDSAANRRQ